MNATLFGITALVYLLCIAWLGYRGYRRTVNHQDYLLAGRSVHPFVMAMSYGAAFISTSAIVGFGGIAGQFGMGLLWLSFMNIAVGIFVAFVFFGRRTRRIGKALDAHTFPEFIGKLLVTKVDDYNAICNLVSGKLSDLRVGDDVYFAAEDIAAATGKADAQKAPAKK